MSGSLKLITADEIVAIFIHHGATGHPNFMITVNEVVCEENRKNQRSKKQVVAEVIRRLSVPDEPEKDHDLEFYRALMSNREFGSRRGHASIITNILYNGNIR